MPLEPSPVPAEPATDGAVAGEPRLSVAAAARRLGVAPATLRTWDRRYGIGPSEHEAGRHRRYSADDIARLELMQRHLVRGVNPAEAARYALTARLPRPGESDRPRIVDGPDRTGSDGAAAEPNRGGSGWPGEGRPGPDGAATEQGGTGRTDGHIAGRDGARAGFDPGGDDRGPGDAGATASSRTGSRQAVEIEDDSADDEAGRADGAVGGERPRHRPDEDEVGDPLLAGTDGPGEIGSRVRVGGRVLRLPGAGRRARGLGRAALALDAAAAQALLADAIAAEGVEHAWEAVARPVLVAVADRWEYTGAGVEIEHMLSECVTSAFAARAMAVTADQAPGRPVLLAGMPGEQHVLPLAVLGAALADRGVAVRSLGPDLPVDALVAALRRTAPAAVVLWSQLAPTADVALLRALPRTRPRARVFAAGPGWAADELPATVERLDDLAAAVRAVMAAAGR